MRVRRVHPVRWFACFLLAGTAAQAQLDPVRPGPKPPASGAKQRAHTTGAGKTIVTVELLTADNAAGFRAYDWRPIFERMGVEFRIRRGTAFDKVGTNERELGPLRQVIVTGRLDRSGRVAFADRTFSRSDAARLKEWFDELKTYGAQGAPEGKPLWGLTKGQFGEVYTALSRKLETEVQGKPLATALASMGLPEEYPVRLSSDAHALLRAKSRAGRPVRQKLEGRSFGTALAILLGEYGLGFRPLRTPSGSIELAVDPLEDVSDAWPVGWEFKSSRGKTAPGLFLEFVPIELDDAKLVDVLAAVAEKSDIPIYVDYDRIAASGTDIETLKVSYPRRKTTWSLFLRAATFPHKLDRKFRIDEQGRPFVWITPLSVGRPDR